MTDSQAAPEIRHWWRTSISDMVPGGIAFRGHPGIDLPVFLLTSYSPISLSGHALDATPIDPVVVSLSIPGCESPRIELVHFGVLVTVLLLLNLLTRNATLVGADVRVCRLKLIGLE